MLVYVGIFILTFVGGVFSGNRPPPCDSDPSCPENEHYTRNNPRCIRTCANKWVPIFDDCEPFTGCVCDGGLVRLHDDASGPCVPEEKCPHRDDPKNLNPKHQVFIADAHATAEAFAAVTQGKSTSDNYGKAFSHSSAKASSFSKSSSSHTSVISSDCRDKKCSDPNAVYKECLNPCPLTCDKPNPRPCPYKCNKGGCECISGYVLNKATGRCVRLKDCPGRKCRDPNAVYKSCPNPCPVSCEHPFPHGICSKACVEFGCECAPGFILDVNDIDGNCVRPDDCPEPIRCPKHSHYVINDNQCLKTCGNRLLPTRDVAGACVPFTGCVCKPGFVRKYDDATGPCIPECDCPPIPTHCGIHETPTSCRIVCPPQTCASIFSTFDCRPTDCEPGCDCFNGYLRNKVGVCIPSKDCFKSEHPVGCNGDVNATRVRGCSDACPPTCEKPNHKLCPSICILNGCDCKPGYIRSCANGDCIDPKDCPGGSPKCGANKMFVSCKSDCPSNYCPVDDSRAQVACSMPYPCRGGCACKKGYLMVSREDPRCVLASDCPPLGCKGDLNATLKQCPSPCPKTCDDPNAGSEGCIDICLPDDCECNPGFVLTKLKGGKCIKPEDCPGCGGDPNAVFKSCPSACEPTCTNPNPQICTMQCMPSGCVCKPGFVKNENNGKCIRPENCPGCEGDYNATYTECTSMCPLTCAEPDPRPCIAKCGPSGCECNPGYVRNDDGKCIKPEDCPVVGCEGDYNATYTECTSMCPLTCAEPDPRPCIAKCGPSGCECNPGYVRNEDGKCIKPEDCPGCGGDPNAVFKSCPSACEPTCTNPNPEICTMQCMPSGCVCKPGFVKNENNGKCIRPENCPGCKGDYNATYTECTSMCPLTCAEPDPRPCIAMCGPSGCECNPGYVRNEDGKCIKPEDCPGCKGDPNAEYSVCPSACQATCEKPNSNQPCTRECLPTGCVCKRGFIRIKKGGKCIKPESCPVPGCGGDTNAVYKDCPSVCEPTCANPDPNQVCTKQCAPSGCVCKPGFVLNEKDGKCIKPESCPVDCGCKGDMNATYSNCPSPCPPTCVDQYSKEESAACVDVCDPPGCVCKPGFIFTKKGGKCIKPDDCPEPGCKGDPNAEYSDCPSACQATCEKPNSNQPCTKNCLPRGCVCKPGFIRIKKDGKCIEPESCPFPGCGGDPNAVYKQCPSVCEPTCANPDPNQKCTKQCAPSGCVCKPGFVLNEKDGKCIKPESCPVDCGCKGDMNATYSNCPSPCPPTCVDQYSKEESAACADVCDPPGCVCKPGFIFTKKGGKCVKPEDCPEPACKGDPNAEYSDCPSACQATCEKPNSNQPCTKNCLSRGCVCKPGYIRIKKDGKCIEPESCPVPGCGGDPNAVYKQCPSVCEPTCANPDPNQICTKQCAPSGCVCKPGFVLNEKDGKCIKPESCPVDCGCKGDMNATYSNCPSPCPPTCVDQYSKEESAACADVCDPPGCVCKPGFIFTRKGGKCIKPDDCPEPACKGDPNAEYSDCPSACQATCEKPNSNQPCTKNCLPRGCVCKPGFIRIKKDGKCIEPESCPVPGCGGDSNAVYKYCPSVCEPTCANPDPNQICTTQCAPSGCVCKPGFVLNEKDGKCIKPESCPVDCGCKGDMNATYSNCPSPCPPTCADLYSKEESVACAAVCDPPGCVCKPGFIFTKKGGKCIKPEDCPAPSCEGDPNAEYSDCPSACQATCERPNSNQPCTTECLPRGCVCKSGFIRINEGGKCIKPESCPVPGCGGDPNAVYKQCPSVCEPTCANPDPNQICTKQCAPSGCVCKPGFVLNEKDGKCIKPESCPVDCGCKGDMNATYSNCPSPCPPTCADLYSKEESVACAAVCDPPGCVCKPGFIFTKKGGKCIKPEDCPELGCKGDPNAEYNDCPSACQATCEKPNSNQPCTTECLPRGCVCKSGFIRINEGGKCIKPESCPGGSPTCRGNETYVYCKVGCPTNYCPVDDSLAIVACDPMYPCPGGCACKGGYLMVSKEDDRCILSSDCPEVKCTRPNEVWDPYAPGCLHERCEDRHIPCDFPYPGPPRCRCIKDYYRNKDDICVPECQCPKPECGYNEVAVPCRQICPPQNCEIAYTDYACTEETKICEPGCNCLPDHLRNGSGICIPNDQCPYPSTPVCGINEIARDCRRICPPQTCLSKYALFLCIEDLPCEPGCDCVPNYLRDDRGICIPSEQCPASCQISDECKRTCANPNPPNCVYNPPKVNIDGCDCKDGYILSKLGGECIPIDQCPPDIACDGDPNARPKRCPKPCPSTCQIPNEVPCLKLCEPIACECKSGYILSNDTGLCILPDNCPGGNPCGENEHFADCKPNCPGDFCPVDDNRDLVLCDPPVGECLSGCVCDLNHRRKSHADPRCIVSSDCPPVNCTRPNEIWCPCPSACLAENCTDIHNQPTVCNTLVLNCDPRCICKKDHFRNESGICIPAEDCPCQISDECKRTCANPNPPNCVYNPPKVNIDGCDCKDGYILSKLGGECIPIDQCPPDIACDGDPNARPKLCPKPCPSTCQIPNEVPCLKLCEPIACECKSGYILSNDTGLCILPDNCPGGNPCGENEHFADCKPNCPGDFCPVDDNRDLVFCDPPVGECLSGCVCDLNHKRKSNADPRCIVSSDCPPVNCTRPNEIWCPCPSACLAENCTDIHNQPTVCNTLVLNCDPRCICKKDHFRNESGICIPAEDCPQKGCNGDMNATFSICPSTSPATCCNPDPTCNTDCAKPGCVCNEGFIQSAPGGPCIRPYDCEGGSPACGDNMTYVNCKIDCPMKYCPEDENEIFVICDPVFPCPSGCECKPGYLMPSKADKTCILAADCPSRNCTRPNEVWDPRPSICNYEKCDQMYYKCGDPNPGRPKCVCKEGYYKDNNGVCIPAEECPKPKCGYNEVAVPCRQICPPQNCEIAYTDYACTEESKICEPGCNCLPDHLRNGSGICIPNEQCPYPSTPVCGINEIAKDCRRICPPQTCLSKYALFRCIEDLPCEPGCDCVPNYLRDDRGICIPSEQCPAPEPICGYNEVAVPCRQICPPQNCEIAYTDYVCTDESKVCEPGCNCLPDHLRNSSGICIPNEQCPAPCQIADECKRTCAEPNPPNCEYNPPKVNMKGCDCKDGYILSELGGDCIPIDQCPPEIACHGDCNARPKRCPKPCPSTCQSPNQLPCKRMCDPIGCQCKPGYILSNDTGICILPDECPGGNPCGKKAHFADCKTDRPGDYCPVDDNRDSSCDLPPDDCLSGCVCNLNYRRKSREDPRCIVASDCPRINCTRPNEKWCPCPSACLAENCEDIHNQSTVCNTLVLNCDPRCICRNDYFRNSSGICIPAKDCPVGCKGDPNAVYSDCPSACEPNCTCPNPGICTTECQPAGCVCKKGFVLNEEDGKCIEPEDCPGCGGDSNAMFKLCPTGNEPTCANPNPHNCSDECKPSGCVCKPGFVLNEHDGKCINPDSCPD